MSRRLFERDTHRMLELLVEQLVGPSLVTLVRYLGGKSRGYKLRAIYAENNRPAAWTITPLNCSEHQTAASLLDISMEPGHLLADASYNANSLYEKAEPVSQKLLTPRRYRKTKELWHHRHSEYRIEAMERLNPPPSFLKDLLETRRAVETRFAHLTKLWRRTHVFPPLGSTPPASHKLRGWQNRDPARSRCLFADICRMMS